MDDRGGELHDLGLQDVSFDAELEGFLTGDASAPTMPGGTVNLSPAPSGLGNPLEGHLDGNPEAPAAGGGAAAAVAAAAAGAVGAALMSGKLGEVPNILGAMTPVPTSMQPVKETAGKFLSKAQPWKAFLLPLSVPSGAEGCSRITANLYHFQTNYAILFVLQLALAILWQPSALFCIAALVLTWMGFLKKNDDPDWHPVVGGHQLGPTQRWLALSAITALVLLFVAGNTIFSAALVFLVAAGIHGVVHDPSGQGLPGTAGPPVPI